MTKRSGKTGRALVVELLVVFLGVAIALAADSWRQSLGDSAREEEYLTSLQAELEEARAGLMVGISETEERLEQVNEFLELIRSPSQIPDSARTPGMSIFIPVVPTGTLDALVLSGAFQLVSDPELRAALLTGRAAVARWVENSSALTTTSRSILSDFLRAREVVLHERALTAGVVPASVLRDYPEVIGLYVDHRSVLRGLRQSMQRSLQSVERLQEILAQSR